MASTARVAQIAALAGEPARAGMLQALMDGRALTATELARIAGITPQTASGHLAQLTEAGLLLVVQQGRHRYHRLASASVARMLETIMLVAAELKPERPSITVAPRDAALRAARTCYDHLAGRLGVALADGMIAHGHVELTTDAGLVTETGLGFFRDLGLDHDVLVAPRTRRSARVLCRPCLDWSERRPHLAGALGAALCAHSLSQGWTRRLDGTRALLITPAGRRVFFERFGARLD